MDEFHQFHTQPGGGDKVLGVILHVRDHNLEEEEEEEEKKKKTRRRKESYHIRQDIHVRNILHRRELIQVYMYYVSIKRFLKRNLVAATYVGMVVE